jgi:hypothetical protein
MCSFFFRASTTVKILHFKTICVSNFVLLTDTSEGRKETQISDLFVFELVFDGFGELDKKSKMVMRGGSAISQYQS